MSNEKLSSEERAKIENLARVIKPAQRFQEEARPLYYQLKKREFEGFYPTQAERGEILSAQADVRVVLDGNSEPLKVILNASLLTQEPNQIEQAILLAYQQAYQSARSHMKQEMRRIERKHFAGVADAMQAVHPDYVLPEIDVD